MSLKIATRGSQLALWQAEYVKSCLQKNSPGLEIELCVLKTKGDIIQDVPLAKVGGKGLFVKEIEEALLDGRADFAVHSIKDVPVELPAGLLLGCIPARENPSDCFFSSLYKNIDTLPLGAHVGTSSLRRQAQLLSIRPDLRISPLRGNVDTRLRKLASGEYDAIVLAYAGCKRLGLSAPFMTPLEPEFFLPAIGQGALGIECKEDNYDLLVRLAYLEDRDTRVCVTAERSFLTKLDGGCQVPIAAHARLLDQERIIIQGLVAEPDGSTILRSEISGLTVDAEEIGVKLAQELMDMGGREILAKLYSSK